MKKIFNFILIVIFSLPALTLDQKVGTTGFSFLKIGVGARPTAMGEAFVAVCGDIYSLYWNPAGISSLQSKEVTFTYNSWLENITHSFFGFVYPFGRSAFGISVIYLDIGEIQGYDKDDLPIEKFVANDLAVGISYAQRINKKLLAGIALREIEEKLEKEKATVTTYDFGLIYIASQRIQIGVGVYNVGTEIRFVKESFYCPTEAKLGCGINFFDKKLNINIDLSKQLTLDTKVCLGIEYWLKNLIAFRVGYKFSEMQSYKDLTTLSLGFGIKHSFISFDYAFVPHRELDNTHRISLNIRF